MHENVTLNFPIHWAIITLGLSNLKFDITSSIIRRLLHLKILMTKRTNAKSVDDSSRVDQSTDSQPYSNTGTHWTFNKCNKTSSEPVEPTLLSTALAALLKERLAGEKSQRNSADLQIVTPKYRIRSHHCIASLLTVESVTNNYTSFISPLKR